MLNKCRECGNELKKLDNKEYLEKIDKAFADVRKSTSFGKDIDTGRFTTVRYGETLYCPLCSKK